MMASLQTDHTFLRTQNLRSLSTIVPQLPPSTSHDFASKVGNNLKRETKLIIEIKKHVI